MSAPGPGEIYDVIVIGTGPIGQTVADRARAAGLSVAAVERELVGGECSYWACVPSKAMLRPVTAVADARRVGGAREAVTGPVDAQATFARRDWWVSSWNDEGQANFLKGIGADLIRGHGRLAGARRVAVETPDGPTVTLTARHAVAVCTGSAPVFPELAELAEARPWSNRAPLGHDRGGRPGTRQPPLARGPRLPFRQRSVAPPPRGLPRLILRRMRRSTRRSTRAGRPTPVHLRRTTYARP